MLPLITTFKNGGIAGDDDDFGGVKMEEVLAGRRVKDVFDVLKCEEGGMVIHGQNGKSIKTN